MSCASKDMQRVAPVQHGGGTAIEVPSPKPGKEKRWQGTIESVVATVANDRWISRRGSSKFRPLPFSRNT